MASVTMKWSRHLRRALAESENIGISTAQGGYKPGGTPTIPKTQPLDPAHLVPFGHIFHTLFIFAYI